MDYRSVIQQSIDYIEDNLKAEITARELAEQAGFSLYHFYRLFHYAAGMPVMQYILRRRLLHGIYAIRCGSTQIDAALNYGFDTYAGFYKAFRREFGCTPATFLRFCRAKRPYRINLKQEEHMIITKKKATEILKHWNMDAESVSDIYYNGTGNKNDNAYYIGESYVLKFTANLGKLKNHMKLSRALESIGLCAAVPVATVDGRDYVSDGECYFYLTRRLPGNQIAVGNFYHGDASANARFVGEIIGQLHLALRKVECCVNDNNLFDTVKKWALPVSRDVLGLTEDFCRSYLDAFGELYEKLPRQIIHRDPNPGNIIRAEDKWGFIDFELSERNVRIYDPCYASTAVLSESFDDGNPEKWLDIYRSIIQGYDSVVELTVEELKSVPYVVLANQMICVAWFAGQEKYTEVFDTNKKMTQWLISHFENLRME